VTLNHTLIQISSIVHYSPFNISETIQSRAISYYGMTVGMNLYVIIE